jgi:hypothetical protein
MSWQVLGGFASVWEFPYIDGESRRTEIRTMIHLKVVRIIELFHVKYSGKLNASFHKNFLIGRYTYWFRTHLYLTHGR